MGAGDVVPTAVLEFVRRGDATDFAHRTREPSRSLPSEIQLVAAMRLIADPIAIIENPVSAEASFAKFVFAHHQVSCDFSDRQVLPFGVRLPVD